MGMNLVVVAEENIEAVLFRDARRPAPATAPFTEAAGRVARLPEHVRHGDILGAKGLLPGISTNGRMTQVLARHQAAARGRADRSAGEHLREPHPFSGETVDVRRFQKGMPHTRQFVVAQLIHHDKDDIGFFAACFSRRTNARQP